MSHGNTPLLDPYVPYVVTAYDDNEIVGKAAGAYVIDALHELFNHSTLTEDDFYEVMPQLRAALLHCGEVEFENIRLVLSGGRTIVR